MGSADVSRRSPSAPRFVIPRAFCAVGLLVAAGWAYSNASAANFTGPHPTDSQVFAKAAGQERVPSALSRGVGEGGNRSFGLRGNRGLLFSPLPGDPEPAWCAKVGRLCPSFLLIGERKCGTSSLFQYLLAHPDVLPPAKKELQHFDDRKRRGDLAAYARNFPVVAAEHAGAPPPPEACMEVLELAPDGTVVNLPPFCKAVVLIGQLPQRRYVTGEASATYLTGVEPGEPLRLLFAALGGPSRARLLCLLR